MDTPKRPSDHFSVSWSSGSKGNVVATRTRGLARRGSSSSSMALALAGVKLRLRLVPFSLPLPEPVPEAATPASVWFGEPVFVISLPNSPREERRLNTGPEPEAEGPVRSFPMIPKAVFVVENLRICASTDGEGFVEEPTDPVLFAWRFSFRDLISLAGS